VVYTTNAIESVNMSLRKATKSRGAFPNDDTLIKLYYLALRNISKKWGVAQTRVTRKAPNGTDERYCCPSN